MEHIDRVLEEIKDARIHTKSRKVYGWFFNIVVEQHTISFLNLKVKWFYNKQFYRVSGTFKDLELKENECQYILEKLKIVR